MKEFLEKARQIGRKAAKLLLSNRAEISARGHSLAHVPAASGGAFRSLRSKYTLGYAMEFKGKFNPVTAMDRSSEKIITEEIRKVFPNHGILAEEGTNIQSAGKYCWVIDPLDGTTNYARGLAIFGVSIALLLDGKPVVGVIQIPKLQEEFFAFRGGGAYFNGKRIRVSRETQLARSFLATGEPYDIRDKLDYHLGLFKKCLEKVLAVRRLGAACYDLANVACGRYDGYWEAGLKPWDVAAGMLLVEEAGGKVTTYSNEPYRLGESTNLLASNGRIHKSLKEILSK